jgi:heme oxygenase
LESFYGFYLPLEERLANAALGFELRHRSPLLSRDLIALGATPYQLEEVARCPDLPRLHTVAEAAGCLYVVEGAALGGQVIAKAIERHLGIGADAGASFFFGDGPDTAARWVKVLAWLEDVAHAGSDRIVASACETFRSFTRWMERA